MIRRLLVALVAVAIATASLVAPSLAGMSPTPPDAPAVVRAAFGCDSDVTVSWDPPAFDGGSPITGYTVYADGSVLAEVGADTLTYGPTAAGPDFTVTASNAVGESEPTPVTQATTPSCIRPPAAPVVTGTGCGQRPELEWDEVAAADGYRFYDDGRLAAELGGPATRFSIPIPAVFPPPPFVTDGRAHVWEVTAFNRAGESPRSNAVELPPCPADPAPPIPRQPQFTG